MTTKNIITHSYLTAQLTPKSKRRATANALHNATEAIKTICELSTLTNSATYRRSCLTVSNEYALLMALKTRLVALLRSASLDTDSYGAVNRMIFALEVQIQDAWSWLKKNLHETSRGASSLRLKGIPMSYGDVLEKHSATIAKHREIIGLNKNIVQTPVPDKHSYDFLGEYVFAMLYGYLPESDDPILNSSEFDEIANDFELVMDTDSTRI
jgi:hypothetical protein